MAPEQLHDRRITPCAGTVDEESKQKRGYKLPRNIMANADLTRLINSDEVQTIVRPPKISRTVVPLKKNPLKNLGALLKLNPYAKAARRTELLAQVQHSLSLFFPLLQLSLGRCLKETDNSQKVLLSLDAEWFEVELWPRRALLQLQGVRQAQNSGM